MSEKIDDVLEEMRSDRQFYGAEYSALADRIEDAYERVIAGMVAKIARLKEEYANAQKDITALRAEVTHKQELNQQLNHQYCMEIARLHDAHHNEQNSRVGDLTMNAALRKRIALLESALNPVLQCDMIFCGGENPWWNDNSTVINTVGMHVACATATDTAIGIVNCHNAVREAKRIYEEGEANEKGTD